MNKIVTRMPPSPTGHLHIGTARTALFNFLYARKHSGRFVMRSEDTDKERSTREYETEIIEGLRWLGIEADEFVRQSERSSIYREQLEKIIESKKAYISKEESKKDAGTLVEVVRLKNPNKVIVFNDLIRGDITFDTTELGDMVIARTLDDALYHFAVVVDDALMGVTHVIRGEDHISNTPRQILIQEALGFERPKYAHVPLILAPDRSKLSKRHGAVSLNEYIREGFLPEAIVNYFALLGWNPGGEKEVFSMDELIQLFDIDHVQKGGAMFSRDKFLWFNKEHLKLMADDTFLRLALTYIPKKTQALPQFSERRFNNLLPLLREKIQVFSQITTLGEEGELDFAFASPTIEPKMIAWKNDASIKDVLPRLEKIPSLLSNLEDNPLPDDVKNTLWPYALEVGKGEVLWPLRVALSGRERSPDPFVIVSIIGKVEAINRIRLACDTIASA